jgi:hypothetical protein
MKDSKYQHPMLHTYDIDLSEYLRLCEEVRSSDGRMTKRERDIIKRGNKALADALHLIVSKPFTVRQMFNGSNNRGRFDFFGKDEFSYPACDHAVYLRFPVPPYRPAAIITHSYVDHATIDADATAEGLQILPLPESVYYPGHAYAAVVWPLPFWLLPSTQGGVK